MRLPRRIILASLANLLASLLAAPRVSLAQTSAQSAPNATTQWDGQWSDAVRAFAGKITSAIGAARSIALEVRNISSLGGAETSAIQQQLQTALNGAGFQTTADPQAEVQVRVTLSEGADGYLWVAEIHSGAEDQVAMTSVPVPKGSASMPKPVPVLRQSFLLSQANPILDFALAQTAGDDTSKVLLTLEPDRVSVFRQRDGAWTKQDSAPMPHLHAWPRDLRGKIVFSSASDFQAHLPDQFCTGTLQPKLRIDCKQSADAPWPLGGKTAAPMAADRNYFNAPADGAKSEWPLTYSIAPNSIASNPPGDPSLKILTEPNGAWLFEGSQHPVATFSRWGDDAASIAGCGDSWNVLATGGGDWTQRDTVQDYEIADRQARMAGPGLEFAGPILALWASDDGTSARAVSLNLRTGMYEASIISLSCIR
jgi:hypothetical protein